MPHPWGPEWAKNIHDWHNAMRGPDVNRFYDQWLFVPEARLVVDAGCGMGKAIERIHDRKEGPRHVHVVGLDFPQVIEAVKDRVEKLGKRGASFQDDPQAKTRITLVGGDRHNVGDALLQASIVEKPDHILHLFPALGSIRGSVPRELKTRINKDRVVHLVTSALDDLKPGGYVTLVLPTSQANAELYQDHLKHLSEFGEIQANDVIRNDAIMSRILKLPYRGKSQMTLENGRLFAFRMRRDELDEKQEEKLRQMRNESSELLHLLFDPHS